MNDGSNVAPPPAPFAERVATALRWLLRRGKRAEPVRDADALRRFLQTRASYVAQMTLYGYLRTRSGVRFPELFNDDAFVASINIAKWQIWLACLSDLAVYSGGMVLRHGGGSGRAVGALMLQLVDEVLAETGIPPDSGPKFASHAARVRSRLAMCDWAAQADDESPFSESPGALVYWAPVVEDLKALDEEIVRNSVRFRWQEIRRQLRELLDARAVLASAGVLEAAAGEGRENRGPRDPA